MKTATELESHLLSKASEDANFRAKLLSDPNSAIKEATGLTVPDGININVHEESSTEFHLIVPPESGAISDDELRHVAGSFGQGW